MPELFQRIGDHQIIGPQTLQHYWIAAVVRDGLADHWRRILRL
jgi:hypothetical protein